MGPTVDTAAEIDAAESVTELIGETPLLRLDAFADNCFGKLEAHNPYSVKDRIARAIVDAAERAGALEAHLELTPAEDGMGGATDHPEELVVVVLPDTGERYLSTDLYEFDS